MARVTQSPHAQASWYERTSETLNWLDHNVPRFLSAYNKGIDEMASRVERVSVRSIRMYLTGTAYSVKAIFTDIYELTKAEFSFSDYFSGLMKGQFIPGGDDFRFNGKKRHFWDLAIRVTSISLLIISGVSGLYAWKAFKGARKPLIKMWNFGGDALSWLKLFTLTGSAALLPFVTLYSLILSCDLQKLALLLTMIEDPLNRDEWHSEMFRNGHSRFKATDFAELKAQLAQAFGNDDAARINQLLETVLRKTGTNSQARDQFKQFVGGDADAKEAYVEFEKSALSLIMKSLRIGDLSFLGEVINELAPHFLSEEEAALAPLDRVNPLLKWAFSSSDNHREAGHAFNHRIARVSEEFNKIFTATNQVVIAARVAARALPETTTKVVTQMDNPEVAVNVLHSGTVILVHGLGGPALRMIAVANSVRSGLSRFLVTPIHALFSRIGFWEGTGEDRGRFGTVLRDHTLVWGTTQAVSLAATAALSSSMPPAGLTLANTVGPMAGAAATAMVHHSLTSGRLGESAQRVTAAAVGHIRRRVGYVYHCGSGNDFNGYYLSVLLFMVAIFVRMVSFVTSGSSPQGAGEYNVCGPEDFQ